MFLSTINGLMNLIMIDLHLMSWVRAHNLQFCGVQVPSYCSVDGVFRTVCCGCHFVLLITLMEHNRNKKQQHFVHFADLWY